MLKLLKLKNKNILLKHKVEKEEINKRKFREILYNFGFEFTIPFEEGEKFIS